MIATLRQRLSPPIIALVLAVVLFFAGGLINPAFVNANQAINIVRLAAFLGIIAAGQTLVIISGREGIDLSVGAIVTLSAILVFRLSNGQNELLLIAIPIALGAGTLVGLINGIGITLIGIPPLVMTLGMAGVVQGTILLVTQGQLEGGTPPIMATLISNPLVFGIPGVVFIWIVLGAVMWLLLERTTYGKRLFAVGVNRTTARLSGVRVQLVVVITYGLSGLLAAFGGFMLLGFTQTVFLNLGEPYLFPSIAAVVVGGTVLAGGKGSYFGTMSGALVLRLIDSLLQALRLQEAYQLIVLGVVLLFLISIYGRQRNLRQ
jgi:ribose transport system permease protein